MQAALEQVFEGALAFETQHLDLVRPSFWMCSEIPHTLPGIRCTPRKLRSRKCAAIFDEKRAVAASKIDLQRIAIAEDVV